MHMHNYICLQRVAVGFYLHEKTTLLRGNVVFFIEYAFQSHDVVRNCP